MKIVDYTVVRSNDREAFIAEVKFLIEKGWQPFGVLTVDNSFNQAMVRYEVAPAREIEMLYAVESVDGTV